MKFLLSTIDYEKYYRKFTPILFISKDWFVKYSVRENDVCDTDKKFHMSCSQAEMSPTAKFT